MHDISKEGVLVLVVVTTEFEGGSHSSDWLNAGSASNRQYTVNKQ